MAARAFPLLLLLVGLLVVWAEMPPAKEAKDICRLPAETGLCLALYHRWYFDWRSKKCLPFVYGGCGGNANNFVTRQDCERVCGGPQKH